MKLWMLRRVTSETVIHDTELPEWLQKTGTAGVVRYTIDEWAATKYTDEQKAMIGDIDGHVWDCLDAKEQITFDDLLAWTPTHWGHVPAVIAVIREAMDNDPAYHATVNSWLQGENGGYVYLRDEVMEPLRNHPTLVQIGRQFNPTTEWHNTWTPISTIAHCLHHGIKPQGVIPE